MKFLPRLLPLGLLLIQLPPADAKAFLEAGASLSETDVSDMLATLLVEQGNPTELSKQVWSEDARATHAELLTTFEEQQLNPADLSKAVRSQHAKDSHADNQAQLKSMFKSLPKNQYGNLGFPAARYALHRLFEHRHRWFVRGLHPKSNEGNDASSKPHILGKAMKALTAMDDKGLSLPALAALAGTLESVIGHETASNLEAVYKTLGHSAGDAISGEVLRQVADSYMTIYISAADFIHTAKEGILEDSRFMAEHTSDWAEVKAWVRDTTLEAEKQKEGCSSDARDCEFPFSESTGVVKTIVEKYGHFNDQQCHSLKGKLLDLQEKRTGRVKLADFYKAGLSGTWEFNEKIDYLRSLGALDESTTNDPKVIVPNYVSSWVNCLSSSKFYSVCCRNECEDFMQVIEKHVAGPTADPDKIVMIVKRNPAFASDSPPNLSNLRHRLVGIAERHHGNVPIHGRLFAQWMHHAFPSTCPYPHEAGKTNPQTPDEWMSETGHTNIKASEDERHTVVKQAKEQLEVVGVNSKSIHHDKPAETVEELPWTDVEELLVVRPTLPRQVGSSSFEKILQALEVAMVGALVCFVVWVAAKQRQQRTEHSKGHKF